MKLAVFPILLTTVAALFLFAISTAPYSTGSGTTSNEVAVHAPVLLSSNRAAILDSASRSAPKAVSPILWGTDNDWTVLYQLLLIALVFSAAGAVVSTTNGRRTRALKIAEEV